MRIAFVARLSDKKLQQKLAPLQQLQAVERIDLFRERPLAGDKLHWTPIPGWVARSKILSNLYRLFSLLLLARRYELIVGCHQQFHGVFAWIAGALWRRPVIQLVISEVDWVHRRRLLRRAMLAARACTVRGELAAARLRAHGYAGRIEVVPNPFRLPEPRPGCPTRDLIAVAHYGEIKGYPWLLEVLAQTPELRLAFGGDGPYEQQLGPLVRKYGLEQRVEYLGWLDEPELASAYSASRALILTSPSEGLPMVVLEAMSHALPVFVTDVGELPWLVRDGVDGHVVPYGDTAGMARALTEAFSTPGRLEEMGRQARARLEELAPQFTIERATAAWDRLLA